MSASIALSVIAQHYGTHSTQAQRACIMLARGRAADVIRTAQSILPATLRIVSAAA